jgi:hypothetical protein
MFPPFDAVFHTPYVGPKESPSTNASAALYLLLHYEVRSMSALDFTYTFSWFIGLC